MLSCSRNLLDSCSSVALRQAPSSQAADNRASVLSPSCSSWDRTDSSVDKNWMHRAAWQASWGRVEEFSRVAKSEVSSDLVHKEALRSESV